MSGSAPVAAAYADRPADHATKGTVQTTRATGDGVRGITLQYATGLFCAFVGAQMLIVPHQFAVQAYDTLRPNLLAWGVAALAAGIAMLVLGTVGGSRWLVAVAHGGVATVLALLAAGFAQSGGWFGTIVYGTLSLGTAVAPWIARAPRGRPESADLFAILIGAGMLVAGLTMMASPSSFVASSYDSLRPHLFWHGLSFAAAAALMLVTQVKAGVAWRTRWLATLLLVGAVLLPMFARALGQGIWTGIVLYGGSSLLLVILPWLGPRLEQVDPRSLRTRLGMTLGVSSALALVLVVAVNANREESSLRRQASDSQQTLATALAHDVADYVRLREAAVEMLAAGPGLLDRAPEEQAAWLQAAHGAYPGIVVFGLFDAEGRPLARSDGRPLVAVADAAWFERIRSASQPVRFVSQSTTIQRPVFAYAVPIRGSDGTFRGLVAATMESARIAEQLARVVADPSQRAYLVDSRGRTIAHPDAALIATFADLSAQRPVGALFGGEAGAGSLVYEAAREEWLAGYARVPGLDWGVVVEQPTSVALASVWSGRERAFVALIVVVALAAASGALAAGWLTAPLATLSLAVRRLTDGAGDARLGNSAITEIAGLAGAFGEMREKLAVRTREHERSEAALRASEEHLRLALQAGRMGTWDWDVRTNALAWDGSLEEIHGLVAGSFDGSFETFAAIVHPDDRDDTFAAIQHALQTGGQFGTEFRVVWPDGSVHWVAGLGRAYYDEAGQPTRMVGIGLEVTEQRRLVEMQRLLAEAGSLLVSTLDYETTLRGIASLIATTTADYCIVEVQDEDGPLSVEVAHAGEAAAARANELLRELEASASFSAPVNVHGGQAAGLPGDGAHRAWSRQSVLVPSFPEAASSSRATSSPEAAGLPNADEHAGEAAADCGLGELHERLARALGARSVIRVPLLARERTIGSLTLIAAESGRRYGPHDLTLAEALAARAALAVDNARLYAESQQAIRARDEFLSIASHELRTPVTGIKGYAQLLLRAQQRGRLDPARLTRSLQAIDRTSDRLTTLIQDLLDVSRIRLGQLPLRLQELDLTELVRRVCSGMQEQLPPSHELILDVSATLPPVQGDADRLEQVLTNLLENAVTYSPDGGCVRVGLGLRDEEIVLSVSDAGIGLPPDAAESIFRPFGRAPNAARRNLPGMGLGLYICRNIVERHGGRVTAHSAGEGLGTTLDVTLPLPLPLPPSGVDGAALAPLPEVRSVLPS